MSNKQKNDNTLKFLGHLYQGMVALEYCLEAKEGDFIQIEQYGDIATKKEQVEVKSHVTENHILSERHEDFWKTLKNFAENYQLTTEFSKLILLTTSIIKKDSKLDKWNKKSGIEKYETLKSITSEKITKTIQPFVNYLFDENKISKENLLEILDKFSIKYGEHRIHEKLEEISKHQTFKIIPKNNRKHLIHNLLGYILTQASELDEENKGDWEIGITEFNERLAHVAKSYMDAANIPLPTQFENEKGDREVYKNYEFVKAINKIEYKEKIQEAIDYYHQANATSANLIIDNHIFDKEISDYQKQLKKSMNNEKDDFILENDNEDKPIYWSKRLFNQCMRMNIEPINGIFENKPFFQRGNMHVIVDNKKFEWFFKKNNDL